MAHSTLAGNLSTTAQLPTIPLPMSHATFVLQASTQTTTQNRRIAQSTGVLTVLARMDWLVCSAIPATSARSRTARNVYPATPELTATFRARSIVVCVPQDLLPATRLQ